MGWGVNVDEMTPMKEDFDDDIAPKALTYIEVYDQACTFYNGFRPISPSWA